MFRPNWKVLLIGAVLVATLTIGGSTADATWGYYHQASWACSPCGTPCTVVYRCDPCFDPCGEWYLGYRPGPIRRALFGPCRLYYGGCGTSCGWGCTVCDTVDTCCIGDAIDSPIEATPTTPTPATPQEAPVTPAEPEPAAPTPPPLADPADPFPTDTLPDPTPPGSFDPLPTTPSPLDPPPTSPEPPTPTTPLEPFGNPFPTPAEPSTGTPGFSPLPEARNVPTPANSGLLTIWVPYDAKVKINGLATKSIGSRRQYVSHGLKSGFEYRYEVLAEVVRDGRIYEEARTVTMTAGARSAVAFGFNIPIPDEALVYAQ